MPWEQQLSPLCSQEEIEAYFGRDNVREWADLNNNGNDTEIEERIGRAIDNATATINGYLRGGPYTYTSGDQFPIANELVITKVAVQLSGDDLYTPRGAQDFDSDGRPLHRLRGEKEDALATLRQIRAGVIRFNDTSELTNIPEVQAVETSIDDED